MAEEDLRFKVTADIGELEKALAKLRRDLGDTEDATDDLGESFEEAADKGEKSAGSLANVAIKAAAAYAAFQGITTALAAFEARAGIINRFEGDISNASKRVNGLASDLELMAAQQMIANRGVELGTKDFGNLSVAVQEYAAATGKDAVQVTEQFAEALGTGSAEALQKFGINLAGVTDKSVAQKMALEQLEEKYGDVESSADTLGGLLGTLGNRISNVANELVPAIDSIASLDEEQRNLNGSTEDAIGFWDRLTTMVGEGVASVGGFLRGMLDDAADVVIAFESVGNVIKKLIERDFDGLASAAKVAASDIQKALVPDKALATASKSLDRYQNKASKVAETVETKFKNVATAIASTGTAAKEAADDIQALMDAVAGDKIVTDDVDPRESRIAEIDAWLAAQEEAEKKQRELHDAAMAKEQERIEKSKELAEQKNRESMELSAGAEMVAAAFAQSVNSIAKGEADLAESFQAMTASLLSSLGEQLVVMGVKDIFMGISRGLSSYGFDATAAGLIANGGASVAAGIAFGAAGAAVAPSGGGGAGGGLAAGTASPTQGNDTGSSGAARAEQTTVININSPVPKEYVGRTINDAQRAAARRGVG